MSVIRKGDWKLVQSNPERMTKAKRLKTMLFNLSADLSEANERVTPGRLFVAEVKAPSESRGRWDYYKLLQTTPAAEAFRPIGEGGCALVRS